MFIGRIQNENDDNNRTGRLYIVSWKEIEHYGNDNVDRKGERWRLIIHRSNRSSWNLESFLCFSNEWIWNVSAGHHTSPQFLEYNVEKLIYVLLYLTLMLLYYHVFSFSLVFLLFLVLCYIICLFIAFLWFSSGIFTALFLYLIRYLHKVLLWLIRISWFWRGVLGSDLG